MDKILDASTNLEGIEYIKLNDILSNELYIYDFIVSLFHNYNKNNIYYSYAHLYKNDFDNVLSKKSYSDKLLIQNKLNIFNRYNFKKVEITLVDICDDRETVYDIEKIVYYKFEITGDDYNNFIKDITDSFIDNINKTDYEYSTLELKIKTLLKRRFEDKGKIKIGLAGFKELNINHDIFIKALIILLFKGDIYFKSYNNILNIKLNSNNKGVYLNTNNGDVFNDGELLGRLKVGNKEYIFFKYLYDNKSHYKSYGEIIKFISPGGTKKPAYAKAAEYKNLLPLKVRKVIGCVTGQYIID